MREPSIAEQLREAAYIDAVRLESNSRQSVRHKSSRGFWTETATTAEFPFICEYGFTASEAVVALRKFSDGKVLVGKQIDLVREWRYELDCKILEQDKIPF